MAGASPNRQCRSALYFFWTSPEEWFVAITQSCLKYQFQKTDVCHFLRFKILKAVKSRLRSRGATIGDISEGKRILNGVERFVQMRPEELLHFLELYKVLVCKGCQYAIQPSGIARHLKEIHHIYRSDRRPFTEYTSSLSLAEPQDVVLPSENEFPVPFLPVEDGFVCRFSGCKHLCATSKRMKSHWIVSHGRAGMADIDWIPVRLQTFFRGNQLRCLSNYVPQTHSSDEQDSSKVSYPYHIELLISGPRYFSFT